ncbi:hypothetical protein JKP88DRAFT_244258 [Tribonema minus]|uniref:Uncharacterized protein n=1 Tax=Tribonema minus TaxID=303371 RepID=A0A835Z5R7_9STRA|nr:hypothetical protein JKP88DRAFT_244258 [Tribonema minus]
MRASLGASSDGGVPLRKTPPPSSAQLCMPHASPPVLDLQDVFSRACCLLNPHVGSAAAAGGREALPHHEQSPSCKDVGSEASAAASCSPTASLTGSDTCSASSNMVDTSSGSVSPEDSDPEDCSCSRRTWNYSSASEYHGEEHGGWQSRATFMQQQYQQRARPMRQQHMGAAAAWDAQMQQQMAMLQQPTFWQHMQMHAHAQHQQQEQQQQRNHHAYLGQQLPPFGSANSQPYFQPQQQQQPPLHHGRVSQEYRRGDREPRRAEGGGGGFRFAPMSVYADLRCRSDRLRRHQHQHSMSPVPLPPQLLLPSYPARGSYPYGGAHHSHSPTPLAQRGVSARQHAWAEVSSSGGGGSGGAAASCDVEVMRQHCLSMHAHVQAQSQPLFIVPVPAACGASYRSSSSRPAAGAPRPGGGGGSSCADDEDRLLDEALAALYEDTERALCRHAGEVMAGKQRAAKRATERWLATQTQAQRDAYMQRVGLSS